MVTTLTAGKWDTRRLMVIGQEPLSPMPPEMIDYHQRQQAELEARGGWHNAAILNAWNCGALMSPEDFIQGKAPLMRVQFLERMARRTARRGSH